MKRKHLPHPNYNSKLKQKLKLWLPLCAAALVTIATCTFLLHPFKKAEKLVHDNPITVAYSAKKKGIILRPGKIDHTDIAVDYIKKGQYKHALALISKLQRTADRDSKTENEEQFTLEDTSCLSDDEIKLLEYVHSFDEEQSLNQTAKLKWLKAQAYLGLGYSDRAVKELKEINAMNSDYKKKALQLLKSIQDKTRVETSKNLRK